MRGLRYAFGLLTLAAAGLGTWWLLALLSPGSGTENYTLSLEFRQARGLKGGAFVRYRGVRVGYVRTVKVAADGDKALVTAVIDQGAEALARQSSHFWIVTPRFDGLTGGATGLDTLVRDSYIAFLTPERDSEPLPSGSLLVGRERPWLEDAAGNLPPPRAGDLSMQLLAASSEGIEPGAEVRYRGIPVGEVRAVRLSAEGSHVEMDLRIEAAQRRTVQESSTTFWVARPRVSGALLSGLAIEDLTAVLEPFVAYRTESLEGTPAPDGWRAIAANRSPSDPDSAVPEAAVAADPKRDPEPAAEQIAGAVLVEVIYEAVEEDWISADDPIARRGQGVLYTDKQGRTVVLTTRTTCDGKYFVTDTFDEAEIGRESIRVAVPGGGVLRAGRQWVAPDGRDLALLVLERAPSGLQDGGTPSSTLSFAGEDEAADAGPGLKRADARTGTLAAWSGASAPLVPSERGAALFRPDGTIVALVGQVGGFDARAVAVRLPALPDELRPAP